MKTQQQLSVENKDVPIDTPLVCSSINFGLNRVQRLSVQNKVLTDNNFEEDLHQQTGGLKVKVFVLNIDGKPLMPCTPAKARHLLKKKKAKVLSRNFFTIQLLFECENKTQNIDLGIDPGFKEVGFSAITKKEELICGEVELRIDVSEKLGERSMYRRIRRGKLWYRKPRFNNRVASKKKGWLAPSILHKIKSHIRIINKIKSLLPIKNVTIESAQFDAHKLKNPDIKGIEYQYGEMFNYENTKMFVRYRDNYTCQICKKKNNNILEVHHIIQRKNGGSDKPDNLVTLHKKCHQDFHKGKIKHTFIKPKSFKEASIMNSLWSRLKNMVECKETFGYKTKVIRQILKLEKTHYNDAFIIAGGKKQKRIKPVFIKQIRRNNRCLQLNRKGFKPSIRKKRYKFQPNDLVRYKNLACRVKGMFSYGKQIRIVDKVGNVINSNIKNVELICYGKGLQIKK